MEDFVFKLPTRVVFARGGLRQLGAECARLAPLHADGSLNRKISASGELFDNHLPDDEPRDRIRRVLLVYGREHLRAAGHYRKICEELAAAGIEWRELGDVRPNPGLDAVRQGIALVREHRLQAVVAVGGGSVLDSAKAVAAGALVLHDVRLFLRGKKSIHQALPLLCLPTLAGSGSELNNGMVLTDEQRGVKLGIGNRHLWPTTTIYDPELTLTTPWPQTLYGAVDAICHLGEFFCTDPQGHPLQDRLAVGLIRTIIDCCRRLQHEPGSYSARAGLLWASGLALSGLNGAGRGKLAFPVHLLAHAVASRHDRPHGAILAALWPAWLARQGGRVRERALALGAAVFKEMDFAADQDAAGHWRRWLEQMAAPADLEQLAIPTDHREIKAIIAAAAPQARLWRLPLDHRQCAAILQGADDPQAHFEQPTG